MADLVPLPSPPWDWNAQCALLGTVAFTAPSSRCRCWLEGVPGPRGPLAHTAGRKTEGGCAALGPPGVHTRPSSAQPCGARSCQALAGRPLPTHWSVRCVSGGWGLEEGGVTEKKGCLRGTGLGVRHRRQDRPRSQGMNAVWRQPNRGPLSPLHFPEPRGWRWRVGSSRDVGALAGSAASFLPERTGSAQAFKKTHKVADKVRGPGQCRHRSGERALLSAPLGVTEESAGRGGSRTGPLPPRTWALGPSGPSGVSPAGGALGRDTSSGRARGSRSLFKTRDAAAELFV